MLSKILLLSSFTFCIIYPLCFWISIKDPLKNNFHKFHLGLPNVVGGLVIISLFLFNLPLPILLLCIAWKASLISVSKYFWKKGSPDPRLLTIPFIFGLLAYSRLHMYLLGQGGDGIASWVLGGFILCSSLFAMNLGHWYLNVHGLPIAHLKRATYILGIFLAVRLIFDAVIIFSGKVFYSGEFISIFRFIGNLDGFLLLIALFFGSLFPLISIYFVKGTLDVKNTQSATGILYVILASILIGDMAYKYYSIKFGLSL